ncbi:hypothetical protein F4678DRAFT_6408 [Xylaria arbuscula]|nr:hypothetical protein F4678DRAFT_6408 [Xylaria arbuscula]
MCACFSAPIRLLCPLWGLPGNTIGGIAPWPVSTEYCRDSVLVGRGRARKKTKAKTSVSFCVAQRELIGHIVRLDVSLLSWLSKSYGMTTCRNTPYNVPQTASQLPRRA